MGYSTTMASDKGPSLSPPEIFAVLNTQIERFMPLLTPVGVTVGFLFPQVFLAIRPFVPWLFGTMTLSGALKLRTRELGLVIRHPFPILLFFLVAHLLMPLMVRFLSALVFPGDFDTVSGYVLLYSVPTAVTGFIWVSIFHGDPALSLALILLDTILAPLVVPGTVFLLLGTKISLDMTGMTLSLVFMVVLPTFAGVGINEFSRGKIPALVSPYLSPFSKFCVLAVVAANTAAVAPRVQFNLHVLGISLVCIVFTVLGFICGKTTGTLSGLNHARKVSVFFGSGLRNTSAAMTLGIDFFPGNAALPAVLGIVYQQTIAAAMGRLLMGAPDKGPIKPARDYPQAE